MEGLKIPEDTANVNLSYDADADVLYLSLGKPQAALGVDIGDGVVVRYGADTNEMVGLTVIGLKRKVATELAEIANHA